MIKDYTKCQSCKNATRTFDKSDAEFEYYILRCSINADPSKCKNYVPEDIVKDLRLKK